MRAINSIKICTFLLLLITSGCQNTGKSKLNTPPLPDTGGPDRVIQKKLPDWFRAPTGWARLEKIESWLDSPAAQRSDWRNYGRIELAEGWLEMASDGARISAYRQARARALLELVQADPEASSAHKKRALRMRDGAPSVRQAGLPNGTLRRSYWGAAAAKLESLSPVGGPWEKITVHHSDAVGSFSFNGSAANSGAAIKSIQRHHQLENDWSDIGYHFLVDGRGRVFEGRSLKWQGAHAGNPKKNRRNIGVCLLGNFDKEHLSQEARDALSDLLDQLRSSHKISRNEIYLHKEMSSTECPGAHLSQWVDYYRKPTGA
jgi:N-acetylmuramoyl-L-alanine amidase